MKNTSFYTDALGCFNVRNQKGPERGTQLGASPGKNLLADLCILALQIPIFVWL
jgi:hypothetical protein